jgi:peroxiredoxin
MINGIAHSTSHPRSLAYGRAAAFSVLVLSLIFVAADAATTPGTGQPAPDFALRTLDRQNVRLSEYRGEVVLITFWATWCGPCQQELAALNGLYEKYNRAGLILLAVNIDDDQGRAAQMAHTLGIAFPVLMDERKEVAQLYQVQNMPVTLLIDREGVVRHVYDNYKSGNEKQYLEQLRELLKE